MDISGTTAPKSDQQNYDDYISGPKTVTVSEVTKGSAEQPVEIHLVEFPGRPYRPSKSMRRVLVACWGAEASAYAGRRLTLYGDPTVKFGGQEVGGIRIAALSHITEPKTIQLTVTRGKRAPIVVQPLSAPASVRRPETSETLVREWLEAIEACETFPQLETAWEGIRNAGLTSEPRIVTAKDAKKEALQ